MRYKHPVEMDRAQTRTERVPRWSEEEKMRLACMEVELQESGRNIRFMNKELAPLHTTRTHEAIKKVRQSTAYSELIERARRSEVVEEGPIEVDTFDDNDRTLMDTIAAWTLRESQQFKSARLLEVAASVMAGERSVTLALLGNYLSELFPSKPARANGNRRPVQPLPHNNRQRRRVEYKLAQRLWIKNRSKCIKGISDGQVSYTMPPKVRMAGYWGSMFTERVDGLVTPVIRTTNIPDDLWRPVSSEDVKYSRLESSSRP